MKSLYLFLFFLSIGLCLSAQTNRLKFKRLKAMPKGKYDMSYASDGEILYIIGGSGHRRDFSSEIFTYYAKYEIWLRLRTEKWLEPQKKATAVYYPPQHRVYVFGGVGEYEPERSAVRYVEYLLPEIRYIDAKTKRWEIWGENEHEGANIGVSTWKDKIYLFGGSIGTQDPGKGFGYLADVREFDPRDGTWRALPDMPYAKEAPGCIIDGVLYTFGGYNGGSFQDVSALDLAQERWRSLGNLPVALSGHVVVPWNKYAILIGDSRKLNYLAIYDTETGKVREFKTNIKGHTRGACVIGEKLYVFGGLLFSEKNSTRDSFFELDLSVLEKALF